MSSMDHRQKSTTEPDVHTNPLPVPGLAARRSSIEQLSFPASSVRSQASNYPAAPVLTRQLTDVNSSPDVSQSVTDPGLPPVTTQSLISPVPTRELAEKQTGELASLPQARNTTTLRQPVLIRGTGKKSSIPRPPQGRRLVIHGAVTAVLALVVLSALFAVLPVSGGATHNSLFKLITGSNSSSGQMNIINTKSNNTGLIAQQAATATAVTQDGYDPAGGTKVYAGVPTAPPTMSSGTGTGSSSSSGGAIGDGTGGPGRFFYGQCTDWANRRYHTLTGYWVPWLGNADQWVAGAYNYSWTVSTQPVVPSIIVLQAGVQGAGGYGHVAVVESINSDGSVVTSDYNWAGDWAVETFVTFRPGPGVDFVRRP